MKYALLGYDLEGVLEQLAPEDRGAFHRAHAAKGQVTRDSGNVELIGHYRFRSSRQARTVRAGVTGLLRETGPASAVSATLRALCIVESDDPDAVIKFAERLPAAQQGATIEIWPLTEPRGSH
jgi:hypothetical protein